MQRERRRDPYPWTWEIPTAATLSTVVMLAVGIQVGRTVANLLAGAGWTWPATATSGTAGAFPTPIGAAFWSSLPPVVAGHSDAGLPKPTNGLAGPGLLWTSLAVTELAVLTATVGVGIWAYLRWGPGRVLGMASRGEAELLLGVTRLRQVAPIVRPDIHGNHHTVKEPVHRLAGDPFNQPGPMPGGSPWLRTRRPGNTAGE